MSYNPKFYKDLIDHENDNSDVSEIGPEDLANIVKGADDMDDALFGFQVKNQDLQKGKRGAPLEPKALEHTSSVNRKRSNDFPEGDLLADISLSDDDFYDVGKKSPSTSKNRDKIMPATPSKSNQEKLSKSKKIANLFGLDNKDDLITDNKKKQESAADWLGIKDSPTKTASNPVTGDRPGIQNKNKNIADSFGAEIKTQENKKFILSETKVIQTTGTSSVLTESANVTAQKIADVKQSENTKMRPKNTGENIFDLLGEKHEQKITENPKDKKSAIFDELFGTTDLSQKKTSRRNSAVKTPETVSTEPTAPPVINDSSTTLGLYTPSSGVARRPGMGRRKGGSLAPTTPPVSLLFQEDWLVSSSQQETKNDTTRPPKTEVKNSTVEMHDNLPAWLGGSVILPETKSEVKPSVQVVQEKSEKDVSEKLVHDTISAAESDKKMTKEGKINPEERVEDTVKEVLADSCEQSHHIALALQRTEAQLLSSLELQSTQNNLAAVCSRQRSILERQEKQLAQLLRRQTERQTQIESQLVVQQERIHNLLQMLTTNLTTVKYSDQPSQPLEEVEFEKQKIKQTINDLEVELQKATLKNEELKFRMIFMEKHYKMEFESLQMQHRREIVSWEDQLANQKELYNQLSCDFKERITQLKENEAELISQHNDRIQRLREERTDDMKQMMQFHKLTLEQMTVLGTLFKDGKNPTPETWKPLDTNQMSEKEEELFKKEKVLSALQKKLEAQRDSYEKQLEETQMKLDQEKMKNEEIARQLKQEQTQLKYKQQQLNQEKKHMEEQYYVQRKMLEEMQEKIMSEKTQLTTDQLALAEERSRLDALAKLQGVSGTTSLDALQSKAEVHGAIEAARSAEMQAVEERRRLREKERVLDTHRWKLQEMEEDLAARADHLDRLIQLSEAKQEAGYKALEEAKQLEEKTEQKLQELERRKTELREKEQSLIRVKLEIAQEEIRISRKRQQLEHFLPPLSSDEAITLQPIKDVIDPKMLIMKLRAEREFEAISKSKQDEPRNET